MAFDLVVIGGRVVDGTGSPWFRADVGVSGHRICAIGDLGADPAGRVINAEGKVVCPGFVDIHTHADATLLLEPRAESAVHQGVTTIVIGNCGFSPVPVRDSTRDLLHRYASAFIPVSEIDWHSLGDLLDLFEAQGLGCNVASLVGHGAIRIAVMGFDDREPSASELVDMCALTEVAMQEGAFGLSSGLAYAPGMFASTEEIVAMARVAATFGGLYTTHIRSDGPSYLDAVREAIEIGEQAAIPVQISHIEPHYPNLGRSQEVLCMVDQVRGRNVDVTFDVPPYMMGMTTITTVLPNSIQEGGIAGMIERLRDPQVRQWVKTGDWERIHPSAHLADEGSWERLRIVSSERHPEFAGLDLAHLSRLTGKHPYDVVFDLLVEEEKQVMIVGEFHSEQDLRRIISHPGCMIESDESVYSASSSAGKPHPRAYGTFPMVFRKYVRGETRPDFPLEVGSQILTVEEAVRRMTSLPATRLGLQDRGLIRKGMRADLVVFDPEQITDRATYEHPHRYPEGIDVVLVNGVVVVDQGRHQGTLPGSVLRRK